MYVYVCNILINSIQGSSITRYPLDGKFLCFEHFKTKIQYKNVEAIIVFKWEAVIIFHV